MSEAENELIHNAIRPNGTADKLQFCIFRVVEDKMVEVEFAQVGASNSPGNLLVITL